MGSDYGEGEIQLPYIDLTIELLESKQGSEEWKQLCGKVREACEEYGCFLVGYDRIRGELREEMFMAMKDLFDLPLETKQKNSHPRPFRGYLGNSEKRPLLESLGIDDPLYLDEAQAFTNLMWPDGNPPFCQAMISLIEKMDEVELVIRKMILESYGVPTYFDALAESSHSSFRMTKYKPPPQTDEVGLGLGAHTDKTFLTILCKDQVNGLELLTKQGHWLQVSPVECSFIVVVGEMFRGWSNGRLHAVEHKVVMRGDKERYSCLYIRIPKDGEVVEVPKELVDDDHPLLFRPYKYIDFMNYYAGSNTIRNALEIYAGVRSNSDGVVHVRLHTVEHRVVMRGDKERYPCTLFVIPKDGEVPKELVDDDHPLLFPPFKYVDFINYYSDTNTIRNSLKIYAGV